MRAVLNKKVVAESNEMMVEGDHSFPPDAIAAEVLAGLARSPKQISPKYFYD